MDLPQMQFRLPVDGRVVVVHGGADREHNHHAHPAFPSQHQAYDVLGIAADGSMHVDDGDRVEEWVGWGMPVVAAAGGTVISAVDGQRDVAIGEQLTGDQHPGGNRVAIRHDDGSVTWYAHLQRGSVQDALLGTRVAAGTRLGLIGNSGNTTAPHLHVQRQVGADDSMDPRARAAELAFSGTRLVGTYRFTPEAGFTDWTPASTQPTEPRIARRGDVIEPRA